ncbi:Cysteine synthase [Enhygromyxa salina]|uniref:Cysteine synthase n=1 Tax=Enhygromyxa salina TaxID=215803 RepID=A0A0C2CUZ3_9BACT|nr:pyridoxal-phosphate dependent enzyme [Enhygromyxa salina]KIG14946.1 Cysteine synthase [Enhygromyxa salina]
MNDLSFDHCESLAPVTEQIIDQPSTAMVLQWQEVDAALDQLIRSQLGPKPQPQPTPRLRVLDLGCGTGRSSAILCNILANRVQSLTLVDGSEVALERAKQRLAAHEPQVHHAELDTLQDALQAGRLAEGSFDVVISAHAVHHLSHANKRALFSAVSRLLALGGKFIMIDILRLSSFECELAEVAERDIQARARSRVAAISDGPLARAPTINATIDRRATLNEHLAWLRQANMEPACAWRGLDTAIFIARARARRGTHAFRPELAPPQFDSVLETIGNTPLVALRRVCRDLNGLVVMKLEAFNPGNSTTDRVAIEMLRAARRSAALQPGQVVVEVVHGATGAGLALGCCVLGHPFVAVMSRGGSMERAQMMRSFGAQVVLVDQDVDSTPGQLSSRDRALAEARAHQLVREHGYFRVDQFELRASVRAHEYGTAQELLRQSNTPIDGFVDLVGPGGTFSGVARGLKAAQPSTVCMAIESAPAPGLAGSHITDLRDGAGDGDRVRDRPQLDRSDCDGLLTVSNEDAIAHARLLARAEGIFAGYATGANLAGAMLLLEQLGPGAVVACLASDSGLDYLNTALHSATI